MTEDQRKICLIENAKSLAPLVSTVILQSDSIYRRIKNVPNISTMHKFPFWLQQDLRSIYQFWKQPTSIPYSLFSAVKRKSFIHSKFHIKFFFRFSDETETIFFHQSNCQNDQFRPIRERQEIFDIFYTFSLTLYSFR